MIKLGIKVKDKITGFTGIVTGMCDYLSGCNQALVQPTKCDGGKKPEAHWFDIQRLSVVDKKAIRLDNTRTPGPDMEAPKSRRSSAAR